MKMNGVELEHFLPVMKNPRQAGGRESYRWLPEILGVYLF
jgi:hypothetical protein